MKRLTEHNSDVLREREARMRIAKLTGVLCPDCAKDTQLILTTESDHQWRERRIGTQLKSVPVHCEACGFSGLMELEGSK